MEKTEYAKSEIMGAVIEKIIRIWFRNILENFTKEKTSDWNRAGKTGFTLGGYKEGRTLSSFVY